ncbi:hypothetical protein [Blastococcus sp. SYSU D00820]
MTAALAATALRNRDRPARAGPTIVHSDRGRQYRSMAFVIVLTDHCLTGSGRMAA